MNNLVKISLIACLSIMLSNSFAQNIPSKKEQQEHDKIRREAQQCMKKSVREQQKKGEKMARPITLNASKLCGANYSEFLRVKGKWAEKDIDKEIIDMAYQAILE